jgi:hypothetical protein
MSEPNLEKELEIAVAAQDSDLVAYHEIRATGQTQVVGSDLGKLLGTYGKLEEDWLHDDIMRDYDLSPVEMRRAEARCVVDVVGRNAPNSDGTPGIQLGKDVFGGSRA